MKKLLIACWFLTLGCNSNPEGQFMNYPKRPISELKKDILSKGDLDAYSELDTYYMDNDDEIGMLPYAMILANKFNDPYGAFQVYECFLYYFKRDGDKEGSLDQLDERTRSFALEYLKRSADGGEWQAQNALGNYNMKGLYFSKDMVKGNELLKLGGIGEAAFIESLKSSQSRN